MNPKETSRLPFLRMKLLKKKRSVNTTERSRLYRKTLDEKFQTLKSSLFASTPEDRRVIAQKILDAEVGVQSYTTKVKYSFKYAQQVRSAVFKTTYTEHRIC